MVIITLLKQGDKTAFAEIYDRYGMMLYFKVNQMLRDEDSAKDLVQDVFLDLWLNPAQVKEESNLPFIKILGHWKKLGNKSVQKKIQELILAIPENPYEGLGKPEQLKHDLAGRWSRTIKKTKLSF